MTSESFSRLKSMLLTYEEDEDDTTISSALSIYNKVLGMVKPVCNIGNVSDDTIHDILIQFDYRNSTFQRDVDSFCLDMSKMLNSILGNDKMVVLVVSVLIYSKNTDIKLNKVNNLINDICSLEYCSSMYDDMISINLMADLFKNNIISSKALSVDSASQMMKVVSSASDLLGSSCVNSSSNRIWCANNCLKTPEELGIKTELIIKLNQQVMNGDPINPNDLLSSVRILTVDAGHIDFGEDVPTIYDIVNIRFCWSFRWIYNLILNTPSEETGRQVLSIVIGCLLDTDKSFKNEDSDILTLHEMVLNALDYAVNGKGYYTHIRAKNLKYKGGCKLSPEHLKLQTKKLLQSQRIILSSLNKYGYFETLNSSVCEGALFDTNVNQGNCRDGNGNTENLYESMSALQTIELDSDYNDIKKLLGESFKLSTMLDTACINMKSQYNKSVRWNA